MCTDVTIATIHTIELIDLQDTKIFRPLSYVQPPLLELESLLIPALPNLTLISLVIYVLILLCIEYVLR